MPPPPRPPPGLVDLPDDVLRLVLARCTPRALTCAASTCRTLRALAAQVPLGTVTLTAVQALSVMRWLWSPSVAPRVHTLVARRCLYGRCLWTNKLPALRSLTLAFCRVRVDALHILPPGLVHLDMHQVLPPQGRAHARVSFERLRRLRVLRLVLATHAWDAAFVARLPRGLRVMHVRGARAMIMESFMPRGLRDVRLHAGCMLLVSNRVPPTVRTLHLRCPQGHLWLGDVIPLRPRRLKDLVLHSPTLTAVPRLDCMTALRSLHITSRAVLLSCRALGATAVDDLELHADDWLGFTDTRWPTGRACPSRLVATVNHVRVRNVPIGAPRALPGPDVLPYVVT